MTLMNPGVNPPIGDRIKMGAEKVVDAIKAPFRAIQRFAERVGDAFGSGGKVDDWRGTVDDKVARVGDKVTDVAGKIPVVGKFVDRATPVTGESRMLKPEDIKKVRPGVVEKVAKLLVRQELMKGIPQTDIDTWSADPSNSTVVATFQADAVARIPNAADPANQPAVDQARVAFMNNRIAQRIVAGMPVSPDQINAKKTEANKIVPLTNEQYLEVAEKLSSPHIDPSQKESWKYALETLREEAGKKALEDYHGHKLRTELRKDGQRTLNEVDKRNGSLLNSIDFAGAIADPGRDARLTEIGQKLKADPVVKAIVKNRDNLTHPITEHKVDNLGIPSNREEVRRGVVYDILGYGPVCYDATGKKVRDVASARTLINTELSNVHSVIDPSTGRAVSLAILDKVAVPPIFSKEALVDKLSDGKNRENLALIMELWAMREAGGNFRTSIDSKAYLQKFNELKGKDFNTILLELGFVQTEVDSIKATIPGLFNAGDQHFKQEVAIVNKPYFDLLAVDTVQAYELYIDAYMLSELKNVLTIKGGKIDVDSTKVTPLNARVYNIVAHDLMNDRDVLNALVEQIIAENPAMYNDLSVLPGNYFLTEREAKGELAPTLKRMESVKDQKAIELCLDLGLSPEVAMRVVNKKERNVLKDFFKGSFNGVGRVLRGVAVILALGAIGGTAGNIIAIGMGLYAAWNLLRGGVAMAGEGIDWARALVGHQVAKFKGDREGADRFAEEIKERTRRLLGLAIGTTVGAAASFVFGPVAAGIIPLVAIPGGKAVEAITTVREKGEIKRILDKIAGGGLPEDERAKYAERLKRLAGDNTQAYISSITTGLIFGSSVMAMGMRLTGTDSLISRWQSGKDALVEDGKLIDKTGQVETMDVSMADRVLKIEVERNGELVRFVGGEALSLAPGSSVAQALERIMMGDSSAKVYDGIGIGDKLVKMFVSGDPNLWRATLGDKGIEYLLEANKGMNLAEIVAKAKLNPGGIWFGRNILENAMPVVAQPK